MSGKNRVYCLYNCRNGNYQILKIWDKNGVPELSVLTSLYRDRFGKDPELGRVGPFPSLEELQRFLFSLAEEWNAGAFHLLLPEELNKCIEEATDIASLQISINHISRTFEKGRSKREGLLGKLF